MLEYCPQLTENNSMNRSARFFKRIMDIAAVLLVSPLVILITAAVALIIRITSGPGVIFSQQRAGKNLQPFVLYKFRTMKTEVDPFGPSPKTGTDPRLTRLGRALRSSSLDELPQLWNVLKGDMSLVGPRPLYVAQAQQWNPRQQLRLLVKPGLTGLAQISGRGSLTIEEKLELDVKYVENQSLLFDAKIILLTLFAFLRPKDIYEKKFSENQDTWKPTE
ncbi:MAG: sugar transferase [Sedimentisphaerales bacterium]|nr:sugar transferase [Sedimentisphaerales bacterium]